MPAYFNDRTNSISKESESKVNRSIELLTKSLKYGDDMKGSKHLCIDTAIAILQSVSNQMKKI